VVIVACGRPPRPPNEERWGPVNTGARRLYRKLGYVETQLPEVTDEGMSETSPVASYARMRAHVCA
jgi:hypothetical protein